MRLSYKPKQVLGCRILKNCLRLSDGSLRSALLICREKRSILVTLPADAPRYESALSMMRFYHDEKYLTQQMMDNVNVLWNALAELSPAIMQVIDQPLRSVHNNCQRMLNMINDLAEDTMLLLKIDTIRKRRYNLVELLRLVCADNTSTALKRGIGLRFRCDIPQLYGYVDADMLNRIMLNLLSNAFKHMWSGGVVEVCLKRRDEKSVQLTVSDTGSGIPPEIVDKVFDRFVTADGDPFAGSGIGLSNVRKMVALHGGTIHCTSTLGQGTKMVVLLPLPCQRVRVSSSFALNSSRCKDPKADHTACL